MIKNIGLDLDGVIYEWHSAVYSYVKVFKDIKVSYDEFWRTYTDYLSNEEIKYIVSLPDIYEKCVPSKEVLDVLHKLSEKYALYYITNRPAHVENITSRWLKRYGFPQNDNLIFTADKDKYIRLLEIDLMVEDGNNKGKSAIPLKNLTDVILFRRPLNEEAWSQFITIGSFLELPKLIDALYDEDYEDLLLTQRDALDEAIQ